MEIKNADIHYGIPDDEYFAEWRLSKSFMRTMLVNPATAKAQFDKPDTSDKDHLRKGSVLHHRIWGGGDAPAIAPSIDKRTKAFKTWRADNPGLYATADELEWCDRAKQAIVDHPIARRSFHRNRVSEASIYFDVANDGPNGEQITCPGKCRVDLLIPISYQGQYFAFDLKSTRHEMLDPDTINLEFRKWRYDLQSEWYRIAIAAAMKCDPDDVQFYFIFVGSSDTPTVEVVHLDSESRATVRSELEYLSTAYTICRDRDVWPQSTNELGSVMLSDWTMNNNSAQAEAILQMAMNAKRTKETQ